MISEQNINDILRYVKKGNTFSFGYDYDDALNNRRYTEINIERDIENKSHILWKRTSGWWESERFNLNGLYDIGILKSKLRKEFYENHISDYEDVDPISIHSDFVKSRLSDNLDCNNLSNDEYFYLFSNVDSLCIELDNLIHADSTRHKESIFTKLIESRLALLHELLKLNPDFEIDELIQNKITVIDRSLASYIIEERVPLGLFIEKENDLYVAIYNTHGDALVEEYDHLNKVMLYFNGAELDEINSIINEEYSI